MKASSVFLISLALALGCVCGSPRTLEGRRVSPHATVDGPLPTGIVEIHPKPAFYHDWWTQIEQCSGKHRSYRAMRVFGVMTQPDGFTFPEYPNMVFYGYSYDRISAFAIARNYLLDSMVVRHEMLHLIASPNRHDPTLFLGKCKGLVSCGYFCSQPFHEQETKDSASTSIEAAPFSARRQGGDGWRRE